MCPAQVSCSPAQGDGAGRCLVGERRRPGVQDPCPKLRPTAPPPMDDHTGGQGEREKENDTTNPAHHENGSRLFGQGILRHDEAARVRDTADQTRHTTGPVWFGECADTCRGCGGSSANRTRGCRTDGCGRYRQPNCGMSCRRRGRSPCGRDSRRSAAAGRWNPLHLWCAGRRTQELPLISLWRVAGLMLFGVNVRGLGW
jgi:hypothetical protein